MTATSSALLEVEEMFGVIPDVFRAMHEAGTLEAEWPAIRAFNLDHSPLPRAVVDTLFAALGLRCHSEYCFVLHSLDLVAAGADRLQIDELARHLSVPPHVPDAERWSRVVRLAWLADAPGPHTRAAAHALSLACTPEEHAQVLRVCEIGALFTSYVQRYELVATGEPLLELLPEELRALVPEFVQYHAALRGDEQRPVCTVCCSCQRLRAVDEPVWYPQEAARELLPPDVLFSHGLCEPCVEQLGFG